jgi:hypothetical protein
MLPVGLAGGEAGGKEDVEALGAEPVGTEQVPEVDNFFSDEPGLFPQLGHGQRGLVAGRRPGPGALGELPGPPPYRVAVLLDEPGTAMFTRDREGEVAAGARTIVVAGVVQAGAGLRRYTAALGVAPRLVRLVVPPEEAERRLRSRHGELDAADLHWHLGRAPELDDILDKSDLPMAVVGNVGPPLATAMAVLTAIEWPLVALQ